MALHCCQWNSRNIAVAAAAFCISSFNGAVSYAFGIFLPELVTGLDISEKAATVVGSLQGGLTMGFGIIAGGLIDILDCHVVVLTGSVLVGLGYILSAFATHVNHLYLTNGLIAGVGLSLQFTPVSIAIQKLFPASQRHAVTGLTSSGSGIGIFLFAPVVRILIDSYGWRASYALIGAFQFNGIALAMLLRTKFSHQTRLLNSSQHVVSSAPSDGASTQLADTKIDTNAGHSGPHTINNRNNSRGKLTNVKIFVKYIKEMFEFSALKNATYCLYLSAMFLYGFGCIIPYTFLPSKAIANGISPFRASLLVSVIGLADTLGRSLAGITAARISSLIVTLGLVIIMGTFNALIPIMNSFETLLVFAILYGLTFGGGVTAQVTTGVELLGVEVLAKAVGVLYTCIAIATSVSLILAAHLWEMFDLPEAPFLMASVAVFSSSIVIAFLIFYHRRHHYSNSSSSSLTVKEHVGMSEAGHSAGSYTAVENT